MCWGLSRDFLPTALGLVLLAACTAPPAPPGGVTPALADVPPHPADLLTPAERLAVSSNLEVDRTTAFAAADVVRERLGRTAEARTPGAPVFGAPTAGPPPPEVPLAAPLVGRELATADGVDSLAIFAQIDRLLLDQRLAIIDRAPPEPAPVLVTSLVFAPEGAALAELERQRLGLAVGQFGVTGDWTVASHGNPAFADARAGAVTVALAELGIPPERIAVVPGSREVDLAEVRVRR